MKKIIFISSIILSVSSFLFAQNDTTFISAFKNRDDSSVVFSSKKESSSNIKMSYGSKGWVMNFDEKFLMRVQWRLQFRYESQSTTPLFFIPEEDAIDGSFNVQRARLKVGGFAYQPYIKY